MKSIVLSICAVMVLGLLGCNGESAKPGEHQWDKAPTLGPVWKAYSEARDAGDGEKCWALLSTAGRKHFEDMFAQMHKDPDKTKAALQKAVTDAQNIRMGDPEIAKKIAEARLNAFPFADAKALFVFDEITLRNSFRQPPKNPELAQMNEMYICGERIEDDDATGCLLYRLKTADPASEPVDGTPFVKEGVEWKVNLYGVAPKSKPQPDAIKDAEAAQQACIREARQTVAAYADAVELYRVHAAQLPDSLEDLMREAVIDGKTVCEPLLPEISKDPWGNEYRYTYSGGKFEILSLGADGVEGGEDYNEDISSNDPIDE